MYVVVDSFLEILGLFELTFQLNDSLTEALADEGDVRSHEAILSLELLAVMV